MKRNFPIMSKIVPFIPWDMIQPHEQQAQHNHSQTLERLAERGGLSAYEAVCVLSGKDLDFNIMFRLPEEQAKRDAWNAVQEKRLTHALIAWSVKNGALAGA